MQTRHTRSGTVGFTLAAVAAIGFAVSACGGGSDPEPAPTDQPITIDFRAVVGAEDFACGSTYSLGTAPSSFQAADLRFYVHDVKLHMHDGTVAPLVLTNDGSFQRDGLALLDFEDGSSACAAFGDAPTHTTLTGRGPLGHVHGIQFTVGVPEDMNHLDATTAVAPLNRTTLFWSWTTGYKHMRIDGVVTNVPATPNPPGNFHNFHLGSTGCAQLVPGDSTAGAVCNVSNRPVVYLPTLEPETQAVVIDLQELFSASNLDAVASGLGAAGCMSGATDPECGPIFQQLGLPFGASAAGQQKVFSAR
jgi:uncharacterized repeat protein (TIGR04052 family)